MEISGKTALITGGASGIGKTTARMLAARGANLMLVDVNQNLGDETVKSIEGEGGRAAFVRADVRDEAQMRHAFEQAVSRFGRLDIVYNNAGIATLQPGFTRIAFEDWKRVLDIDLLGVVLGCYLAFPLMREHGGVIVNTASMAGVYPIPGDPVYAAAKAGVIHLTHSLEYWSKRRIRINCVCPGVVDTPLSRAQANEEKAAGREAPPVRTIMAPEAIAEVVLKFVEDDSQAGQVVEVRPSGVNVIEPRRAPHHRR
ncbi:MAG TPA: SDR family oxidoreductase [Candidatus Binataceae bacterium]|jgi:NAD(P)-dependent dehydrogenase (short-subunit alcohol dehydrogenase family)|nr:SDR family oxidoreductase [Candidatus Binataceae bacterium]